MSRARKLAAKMADAHLMNSPGISKSAGTRESLVDQYIPVAEAAMVAVGKMEKAAAKYNSAFDRLTAAQAGQLAAHDRQWHAGMPRFGDYEPEFRPGVTHANGHLREPFIPETN